CLGQGDPRRMLGVVTEVGVAAHVLHMFKRFWTGFIHIEGGADGQRRDDLANVAAEARAQLGELARRQHLRDDDEAVAVEGGSILVEGHGITSCPISGGGWRYRGRSSAERRRATSSSRAARTAAPSDQPSENRSRTAAGWPGG